MEQSSDMEYAQVLPKLFIGSHPRTAGDVETLRRELRISAVLNLQTDDDMAAAGVNWPPVEAYYPVVGIQLYRFPIKEEQAEMQDKFAEAVRMVDQLLASVKRSTSIAPLESPAVPVWPSGISMRSWIGNLIKLWRM